MDTFRLLLSLFASLLAAWAASVIWNLFFHPLARFPGPRLAAATRWYITYYEVFKNGALVDHLVRLHDEYGPVVRFGPNNLHFSSFAAYNDIYARGVTFRKDAAFYDPMAVPEASFGYIDPRDAKARREVILPLFSRQSILKLESLIQDKVETLLVRLAEHGKGGATVNVSRALRSFALDVILSYCTARDPRALDVPAFEHGFILTQETLHPFLLVVTNFPWLATLVNGITNVRRALFGAPPAGDLAAVDAGAQHARRQVDEVLADPSVLAAAPHDTIFHHLLAPRPEKGAHGAVPSRTSLYDEAQTLVGAGGDTVTSTAEFGFWHLLKHADARVALQRELDELWSAHDAVGLRELEKLPYLTAVVKESLRLSHGVVYPLPRVVDAAGAVIDGHAIPAGAVVSSGSTFMHYDPDVFPEPRAFKPERWLRADAGADAPRLDQHLVAFSKGPRSCLGQNLAWAELYLLFGCVFRNLDLCVAPGTTADYDTFTCQFMPIVSEDRRLRCQVRRREL